MEDLSIAIFGGPVALTPSSMAEGNTISRDFAMKGPGSVSESTATEPAGDPRVEIPPARERTVMHPGNAPLAPNPWNRADGSAWETSADESSPGRAAPGPWGQA